LNEVFGLRRSISQLNESPERPFYFGGATRGEIPNLEGLEFSGSDTYVKTINIIH
jgi:hypothetical protein